MKIIIDAMGGDNAPQSSVSGAVLAARDFGVEIVLVGDESQITACLAKTECADVRGKIEIVHTADKIEMDDSATSVTGAKKNSSLAVAMRMLAQGAGDALVCAGNTGAVLVGATMIVKRIRGVRRAALAPILPTKTGGSLLIDCGANVECTPEYLLQFACMGSLYVKRALGIAKPTVGLVNNGAEASKGTEMVRAAYGLLDEAGKGGEINFIGNVEGRDIPQGKADIVVCDGFTGNILLKTYEGVALYLAAEVKAMFMKSTKTKMAALMMKNELSAFKKQLDYKEVGGAPLLGICKPVIKAHGSCDERAMRGAINQAIKYAGGGIIEEITKNIGSSKSEEDK